MQVLSLGVPNFFTSNVLARVFHSFVKATTYFELHVAVFFCHDLLVQSIPHKSNDSDLFFFLILQVQGTFSLMSLLDGTNIR